MDQKTDTLDVTGFYDHLSSDYDVMTGFEQRFVHERPFIKLLVDRYRITRAVDAGTGTGFHALLLARLGVHVTAIDLAPAMIAALERHAVQEELQVAAVVGSIGQLPVIITSPQDAVLSMGNTLAHMPTLDDLQASLRAFRQVLRPGGILLVQMLNYRRILALRDTVVADKVVDGVRFLRWYTYEDDRIRFHVTREVVDGSMPADTRSIELSPFLDEDLRRGIRLAGFEAPVLYGSIALEQYDEERSRDLVILARVPGD